LEAGLDLEMPGPPRERGDILRRELEQGLTTEARLDALVDCMQRVTRWHWRWLGPQLYLVEHAPQLHVRRLRGADGEALACRGGRRTAERLADHFAKHGAEFNAPTADAYLVLAQTLRATPPAGDVLEIVRPTDGVISKFDRQSGAFIAFDADSTIRTFFKPNDGEAYFRRQARRRPN
jgi:hypothetical protein